MIQMAKEKKELSPLEQLKKKHREEVKALTLKLTVENYNKLMTALKTINPGKTEDEIIAIYEAEAKAKQ